MASARMNLLRRVGGLPACLLVVGFLVWGVAGGWSKAASFPWHIDWPGLAVAVAVLASFLFAWGAGYVGLLETLSGRRLRRLRFMSIWARSLLGRYVPGNVLMVAGRVVFGRAAGVPGRVSLAASVYEQVAMLVAAALASAAFLLVAEGRSWPAVYWSVLAVPLVVVLLDPAVLGRATNRLLKRFGQAATLTPLSRARVLLVLVWFGVTMGLLALGTGLAVRAVAGSRSGDVAFIGLGFLLAWVVSMLAFVFPSGLGVREGVFALILASHLPTSVAVSLAAASRLLLTAVELVVIALVVVAGRLEGTSSAGDAEAALGSGRPGNVLS